MKILFVCTGNTCRSPMAESIARIMAEERGLEHEFASAGTAACNGLGASIGAMCAVQAFGGDLSDHQSACVHPDMLEQADLVLTMTESQCETLKVMYPEGAEKIHTLRGYAGLPGEVQDPYGGNLAVYAEAAADIAVALDNIIR